jgi:hypothetical protein
MSVISYAPGILPLDDPQVIHKCLVKIGYTNAHVGLDLDGTLHCHVDETDDVSSMQQAIESVYPPPGALSHDAPDPLVVECDGVTTAVVTITDPRGADAVGKTVKVLIPGGVYIPISADSIVLDSNGEGAVTVGPMSGCLNGVQLLFYYDSGEADAASLSLRFGSV